MVIKALSDEFNIPLCVFIGHANLDWKSCQDLSLNQASNQCRGCSEFDQSIDARLYPTLYFIFTNQG
ncbi:hypothetical protein PEX1_025020 [Penicillium expansum]|uniref:Uncharacterized protein n=1 Tax=Penicillium expansum TaxID=27334 RepID=A0A0A2J0D0_PENEN|nr:hypothetical protein PEX2_081430 [Penicillium expansum]KGO48236.1 hypothetical protein PEXP_040680 [Penicillium expansum]KGO52532.1 hypothetical protein PEX2_081430 [Penicillium expansum]KGO67451.1 hypothetical protein PEX1_025020 [Penicillium expansum]